MRSRPAPDFSLYSHSICLIICPIMWTWHMTYTYIYICVICPQAWYPTFFPLYHVLYHTNHQKAYHLVTVIKKRQTKRHRVKTKTKIWCGFGCWAEERIFYQVIWVRSSIYSWVKSFQKIQTFHGQEILKRFKVVITCTAYNIWTLLSSLLNLHTPNKPHPLLPCGCFLLQTCDPTANNNFDSDIIQPATPDAPYFLDFPSKPVFDRKENLCHCSVTNFRSTFQLWRGLFLTEMRGAKGFPGIETNSAEPRKTLQKRCQAACNSILFHLQLKTIWQTQSWLDFPYDYLLLLRFKTFQILITWLLVFKWFLRLLDCKIGLLLNLCSRQEKLRSNVIRCRCQLETCNLAFVTRCFFWWWHLWRWWRWGICPIILFKRLFFANECLLAFSSSRSCQILFDPKNIVLLPPSCALINLFPLSVCFFVYLRSFVAFFCPLSSISLSMA